MGPVPPFMFNNQRDTLVNRTLVMHLFITVNTTVT